MELNRVTERALTQCDWHPRRKRKFGRRHTQREDHGKRRSEKMAICEPREEAWDRSAPDSPQQEPAPRTSGLGRPERGEDKPLQFPPPRPRHVLCPGCPSCLTQLSSAVCPPPLPRSHRCACHGFTPPLRPLQNSCCCPPPAFIGRTGDAQTERQLSDTSGLSEQTPLRVGSHPSPLPPGDASGSSHVSLGSARPPALVCQCPGPETPWRSWAEAEVYTQRRRHSRLDWHLISGQRVV